MTKTVHAIRHGGNLELLEPIDIPEGTEVTVTVEFPPVVRATTSAALPIRSLGPMNGSGLAREDIYGDAD
jgi:predicted DNA-binding antitoxin AbrB/MazE fold protein